MIDLIMHNPWAVAFFVACIAIIIWQACEFERGGRDPHQ